MRKFFENCPREVAALRMIPIWVREWGRRSVHHRR